MEPLRNDADFLRPRSCFREPIPEIFQSAELLRQAVERHRANDRAEAEKLIITADNDAVREWLESLWGSSKLNPDQRKYLRVRKVPNSPPILPKSERLPLRMPSNEGKMEIVRRRGRTCAFCGIPLITVEVRKAFNRLYPNAARWGSQNTDCHAAFACMWLQYDHILPHSRGGDSSLENLVLTCAGCNFGRMGYTLEQVGLLDPRLRIPAPSSWDGLEAILSSTDT